MNKRGFTLVELLAVIVILGVLATTATYVSTRQLEKVKQQAYDQLAESSYDAAQNYMLEYGLDSNLTYKDGKQKIQNITIKELVKDGKLEDAIDPATKSEKCTGIVKIKLASSGKKTDDFDSADSYAFRVCLKCVSYKNTYDFPKDEANSWSDSEKCTDQDYESGKWDD